MGSVAGLRSTCDDDDDDDVFMVALVLFWCLVEDEQHGRVITCALARWKVIQFPQSIELSIA